MSNNDYTDRKNARTNRDLLVLLDVSGSMAGNCPDGNGNSMTRLQLCTHSLCTIVQTLAIKRVASRLCVLTFSGSVTEIISPRFIDSDNCEDIKQQLAALRTESDTQMFKALAAVFNKAAQMREQTSAVDIFFFTDGMPSDPPTDNTAEAFRNMFPFGQCVAMHTFGFGQELESRVLYEMSLIGGGIFKYINDASMVATNFINSMAKFIIDSQTPPEQQQQPSREVCGVFPVLLKELYDILLQKPAAVAAAKQRLDNTIGKIDHPMRFDEPELREMLKSSVNVELWGRHYLLALISCHAHMHCGNFKDAGLQAYASNYPGFSALQEEIKTVFLKMEVKGAPKREVQEYVNPSGGCFAVHCMVAMHDGTTKIAGLVQRGDRLKTVGDEPAVVKYVVYTPHCRGLVKIGKLKITKYHPVCGNHDDTWVFPWNVLGAEHQMEAYDVVTFVLEEPEKNHVVFVEGIRCITLGHNIQNHPVLTHDFFGHDIVKALDHITTTAGFGNIHSGLGTVVVENIGDLRKYVPSEDDPSGSKMVKPANFVSTRWREDSCTNPTPTVKMPSYDDFKPSRDHLLNLSE